MLDDFAVFILTHGRADNVVTYKSLIDAGYTGRVYIVIDNEDKQADRYYQNYGDKVIMFDKAAIAETFDEGDNFQDRRAIIYARNACFDIAERLGIEYFIQLDDDYTKFRYRLEDVFDYSGRKYVLDLNNLFLSLLNYYKSIPAKALAVAQGGDFIGGVRNGTQESINRKRKCMNTFICSTHRKFPFIGRINEDVNTYTHYQNKGNLFLTYPMIAIDQHETQDNQGGMSEMYIDSGTYIKSFYTVMYQPSSVKVGMIRQSKKRLHHSIDWETTVPCVISEEYKK